MKYDKPCDDLKQSECVLSENKPIPEQKRRKRLKGKFAPEYILTPLPKSEI